LGIGGADMVGFFHNNNVWAMNIDGSDIRQLSDDSTIKTDLQWTVDGEGLSYISDNKCLNIITLAGEKIEVTCLTDITHFESFQVSPDGTKAALTINRTLYVIPFEKGTMEKIHNLDELNAIKSCVTYSEVRPRIVRWSNDSAKLGIIFLPKATNQFNEAIRILDVSTCKGTTNLDEFPSESTFTPNGYSNTRLIPSFTWNGASVLMNTSLRNGGYGDLFRYDLQTHSGELFNPLKGVCCYRDTVYSPDGKFIFFAFQDIALSGDKAKTVLYYASIEDLKSGAELTPLPLPDKFFGIREIMQFVLRVAKK
jgi:Tol biopolymer transport system component